MLRAGMFRNSDFLLPTLPIKQQSKAKMTGLTSHSISARPRTHTHKLLYVESVQLAWGYWLAKVSLTGHHLAASDPCILAVWLQACSNWQACPVEYVLACVYLCLCVEDSGTCPF